MEIEFEGVRKTRYGYQVNDKYIYRDDALWKKTMDRVVSFEKKYSNKEDFEKHMETRLKRIKNLEKVYYTIAVLLERGHQGAAELYDSRLVLEMLSEEMEDF
jgi:uncharacterized lipoprotein YehR (DUF1307 family)